MTLYNLVRCTTATLGTADIVVGSAMSGYKDFTGIPNGATVSYGLRDIQLGVVLASEVGSGTWTSATSTLARNTVYSSTNGGNKIVLVTGTAEIYLTALAEDITTTAIGAEPADATIVKAGNANWIDLTDSGVTTLHSHAINVGTGTAGQVVKWGAAGDTLVDAGVTPADLAGLTTNTFTGDQRASDFVSTRSGTITRDVNGYITSIAKTDGRTITLTRDADNYITSAADGTNTWTFTRVADIITSWSVT
jgi:hypothetical protein